MYCIGCGKKINLLEPHRTSGVYKPKTEEEILWGKDSNNIPYIKYQMVDGGVIHTIDAGYGSIHDGSQFIVAICDDCITKNCEGATILFCNSDLVLKDEIERSKKIYRRRRNLDDLT